MQSLLGFCYTFPWIIFIHFPIKFDYKQSCRNKTQEKSCNKYVIIGLFWFLSHFCLWYNDISGKHSLLCKLMSGQSKTRVALPDRQWAEQTGGTLWKHFPLLPELLSLDKLSSEILQHSRCWDWVQLWEINGQWEGKDWWYLTNEKANLWPNNWLNLAPIFPINFLHRVAAAGCCTLRHFNLLESRCNN